MEKQLADVRNWQLIQYKVEKACAEKIKSGHYSIETCLQLLHEAYAKVKEITNQYSPGLSETGHSNLLIPIICELVPKGGSVLDIGCAGGSLIAGLAQHGYHVKGVDIDKDAIETAKKMLWRLKLDVDCVEHLDILDFHNSVQFSCIVMDNVIEHLIPSTVEKIMRKAYDLLNSNGSLIIITPHRFSGPHDISAWFLPLGSISEGLHLKEYTVTEIHNCLKMCGFDRFMGLSLWPGYYKGVKTEPSTWALKKARYFEKLFSFPLLKAVMKVNRTLSHRMVATFFPGFCVALKSERNPSSF